MAEMEEKKQQQMMKMQKQKINSKTDDFKNKSKSTQKIITKNSVDQIDENQKKDNKMEKKDQINPIKNKSIIRTQQKIESKILKFQKVCNI
jgi:hypothetical protein